MAFIPRAYLLHTPVQQRQQREGPEPTIQSSGTTADSSERRLDRLRCITLSLRRRLAS